MERVRPGWAVKAIVVILLTSVFFRCVCATNHSVGGPAGWDLRSNLQTWSATTTFFVGDDLGTYIFFNFFYSLSLLTLIYIYKGSDLFCSVVLCDRKNVSMKIQDRS